MGGLGVWAWQKETIMQRVEKKQGPTAQHIENSMERRVWLAAAHGVTKSQTQMSN